MEKNPLAEIYQIFVVLGPIFLFLFVFFAKMFLSRFEKVDFLKLLGQDDLPRPIGTAY